MSTFPWSGWFHSNTPDLESFGGEKKYMNLKNLVAKLNEMLNDETAELEVYQSSCFDDPLAFSTSGCYLGEVWVITDDNGCEDTFVSEWDANNRLKEEEYDNPVITMKPVVIFGS